MNFNPLLSLEYFLSFEYSKPMKKIHFFIILPFVAFLVAFLTSPTHANSKPPVTQVFYQVPNIPTPLLPLEGQGFYKPTPEPNSLETTEMLFDLENFQSSIPDLEKSIASWNKVEGFNQSLVGIKQVFDDYRLKLKQGKLLSSWDLQRAINYQKKVTPLVTRAEQLRNDYLSFVSKSDALHKELKDKRLLFKRYLDQCKADATISAHIPTVQKQMQEIDRIVTDLKKVRQSYTLSYQKNYSLLGEISEFKKQTDNEITTLREARFTQNALALFNPDFFVKIRSTTKTELKAKFTEILISPWQQIKERRLEYFQMIGTIIILWLVFKGVKKWFFSDDVYFRPFLFALTLTFVGSTFIFSENLPIIQIAFWILIYVFSAVMIFLLPRHKNERTDLFLLLSLFIYFQISDVIGLPLQFFRLSIFFLSLAIGIYAQIRFAWYKTTRMRYALLCELSALLCFFATLLELFGYHLLALLILQGMVRSVIIIVVSNTVRHYLLKFFQALLNLKLWDKIILIRKSKSALISSSRLVIYALFIAYTLSGLIWIWGSFESYEYARIALWKFGYTSGERTLSFIMILKAFLIVVVSRLISQLIQFGLDADFYPKHKISHGTGKSINSLINYSLWTLTALITISVLGFDLKQLAFIAGALSVGIGFGLQNIVNNFVSGLILLFERPIKVGDSVEVNNKAGVVEKVGLRSTLIRNDARNYFIVPNSDLVTQNITNLSLSETEIRLTIPVVVAHGMPLNTVRDILLSSALAHPLVTKGQEPVVLFTQVSEVGFHFDLSASVSYLSSKKAVISEILFEVDTKFKENGISWANSLKISPTHSKKA